MTNMNMKWSNFNKKALILTFVCLVLICLPGKCNDKYEKRVDSYQTLWNKLIPNYTKMQFAGGMGLLSFGTGWDYGKNDQWETDVFLGFLPKFDSDKFRITFTLKQNFIPWKLDLGKNFSMDPLSCSFYVNTIFGNEYWMSEPDKYPDNYYRFSTKMRFNLSLGQRFTYTIPPEKRRSSKSITVFYELGTNELYIISAAGNSYLKPTDYIKLSLGVKFQIF